MKTSVAILSLILTLAVWQGTRLSAIGAELADGEIEFVHELLSRQLFELAEQFCGEQLKSASDVSERADWELLLSECHQQHAWWMDDDSRNGMISLAAQRITEFLRKSTPSAEKDVQLRVRQIELIAASGIMEETVRGDRSGLAKQQGLFTTKPRKISVSTKFALEAMSQGSELAESLLKQIDQISRDIDRDVVRTAREQIRLAQAQMLLARSRLLPDRDASGLRDRAGQLAEPLVRSSNDADVRFSARLLLAEIQLDRNDFAAFDLRFTSLLAGASSDGSYASAAALKIRALLKQNQPSEALQEWVNYSREEHLPTPELVTLRLQAMLQMMELICQLEESPERTELSAKTSAEFLALKEKTLASTRGVWRDRCLRIAARFERVQQVGPEAASSLEEIAALVEDGELQEARKVLHELARRSSTGDSRLSAIFLLQSGDLAVRLNEWASAEADLRPAIELFQQKKDIARAAAADLLRVYAIGQQWNANPRIDVAEQTYRTALNEHIATYAGQPTIIQAREWRARLMRTADPLEAAEEILQIVESEESVNSSPPRKSSDSGRMLERLCLAGDLLLDAMTRESALTVSVKESAAKESAAKESAANVSDRLDAAVSAFAAQSTAAREVQQPQGLTCLSVLEAQQLGLMLRNVLSTKTNWTAIDADSRRLLAALSAESIGAGRVEESTAPQDQPALGATTHSSVNLHDTAITERSAAVCHAMIVLASVRQLSDAAGFESSRNALMELSYENRLRTVRQLMRQMAISGERVPGDPQLAHLLISMVTKRNLDSQESRTVEEQIEELTVLNRLCSVAGDHKAAEAQLDSLIAAPLTDSQLMQVAEVVAQSASAPEPATSSVAARKFWQAVQKRTKPGQDAWFEASLQMAVLADSDGNRAEAARILGVVSVLHPDWGNASRKARAEELEKRLGALP